MEFLVKWKQKLGKVFEYLYEDVREAIQLKNNVNKKQNIQSCKHIIKNHNNYLSVKHDFNSHKRFDET